MNKHGKKQNNTAPSGARVQSKLKEGRDSADEGRRAGASKSPPLSASPAASGELSPVRVREEAGGRGVLETTPPPDDAAAAAAPQGDELDALLGPAIARERPGRKDDKGAAEAAPEPVVGLQSRGSTLTAETVVIGDGGASWRRRAQQRSRQRAAEEGRSVDDGALQRSERAASGAGMPLSAAACLSEPGGEHVSLPKSLRCKAAGVGDGSCRELTPARMRGVGQHKSAPCFFLAGPSNRDAERRRGGRAEDRHAGRAAYLRSDEDVAARRMRRIDSGDANTAFRGRRSDAKTQDEPGAAPGRATGEAQANGRGGGETVRVTAPANAKASPEIEAAASPASGGNFGAAAALRARIRGTAAPEAARAEFSILPQVDSKVRAHARPLVRPHLPPWCCAGAATQIVACRAGRRRAHSAGSAPARAPRPAATPPSACSASRAARRCATSATTTPPTSPRSSSARATATTSTTSTPPSPPTWRATRATRAARRTSTTSTTSTAASTCTRTGARPAVAGGGAGAGRSCGAVRRPALGRGRALCRRRRGTREQQEERAHKAAVADARRVSAAAARCALCLASAKCPRELLLSLGQQTYMALPPRGALAPGHVVICAAEHVPSFRAADENVFEELKNFRKCLIQMFATQARPWHTRARLHCGSLRGSGIKGLPRAQDKSVVFMETAVRVQEGRAHACVHAVPLAADAFARAPLVFRQELDGAESEWAQHHAQRLIDSGAKGLRRSIPEKFPYFHVEFGYNRGYVHVIDDEAAWPRDFGRGVLLGLLGRDEEMHARAQRAGAGAAAAQAAEFLEGWEAFDWTKQL